VKLDGHPSTHGHHVNSWACGAGSGRHGQCSGFSGGYDTYICGCCCHDRPGELTEEEARIVARLRGEPAPLSPDTTPTTEEV
jgi:hypothetical protein